MICAVILLFLNIHIFKVRHHMGQDRVTTYLQAASVWTLYLFAITELLSLINSLSFFPLASSWGILDVILIILLILQREDISKALPRSFPSFNKRYLVFAGISAVTITLAIRTVSYNWDSMTYHLSRIAHWAQNESVAHYATNSIRQITSPVLAEFINLHVYILTGGSDLLCNLLQCFSYLTCALIVWRIARKLHCTPVFCYIAALLYLAMPIAFAEALTTQTDNISAVWLLAFVYILLDYTDPAKPILWNKNTVSDVCTMGLMVAFGYLTKPSVCIAMVIFVLWLLLACLIRKDHFLTLAKLIGCVLPCILLPILPEMLRNIHTFAALSDPIAGQRQIIGTLQPNYIFINFLKNITYNMPTTLLYDSPALIKRFIVLAAGLMRVTLDHPSISEDGTPFMMHMPPDYGHDTALNPLIVWLFFICILWGILRFKKDKSSKAKISYSLAAAIAFLVFCAVLRWEPFVSRYMTGYFALLCPMIAFQLQKFTQAPDRLPLRNAIIGIICFICITDIAGMSIYHRNLCARNGAEERPFGYFVNRTAIYNAYAMISNDIISEKYQNIGIYMGENDYEYPFWVLLDNVKNRIEHVNVSNASAGYADTSFHPECIIWLGPLPEGGIVCNGLYYDQIQEYGVNQYLASLSTVLP